MSKIILGYEKIEADSMKGWHFNGRVLPNSAFCTADENSRRQTTYQQMDPVSQTWYNKIIEPEKEVTNQLFEMYPLFNHVQLAQRNHVNMQVDQIPASCTYFYPIQLANSGLYVRFTKKICISERVRNDVLSGKAYILFCYSNEGDMRNTYVEFNHLVSALQLPKERVLLIHGDNDVVFFKDAPYMYIPANEFPYWLMYASSTVIPPDEINTLFLCYNRTLRVHKVIFLLKLAQHNLLDSGIISVGHRLGQIVEAYNLQITLTNEQAARLKQSSPDNKIFPTDNPAVEINSHHFAKTFLSVVTETLDAGLFFSEKTFKPILLKHPFIIVGAQGLLAKLKEFGYQTFSKWWNEDYDNEPNLNLRIDKVIAILNRLNQLSFTELQRIREDMADVLAHNHLRFQQTLTDTVYGSSSQIKNILLTYGVK